MGWMWISGIVFLVVIFLLLRMFMPTRGPEAPRESAEEILKQRYARGEITQEEYERRLSDLRK